MDKPHFNEAKQVSETAEYSVYVYHFDNSDKKTCSDWEKKETTSCPNHALTCARIFHESGRYKKVEIKKKMFDPGYDRCVDMTFKVYEKSPGGLLSAVKAWIRPASLV